MNILKQRIVANGGIEKLLTNLEYNEDEKVSLPLIFNIYILEFWFVGQFHFSNSIIYIHNIKY